MDYDKDFIQTFNDYYPFERYILETPKTLELIFDDILLTEIFIPATEIKPITNNNGNLVDFTKIADNEIYVKVKGPAGEMRIAYYDFAEHVREDIRYYILQDFGGYEWQCLYAESDDLNDLKNKLIKQKELIEQKYNICNIKKFVCNSTLKLLKTNN